MTAQNLIDQGLRLIGVLGAIGRTASTEEYANCLVVLNQLLASLSAAQQFLYQITDESFALSGAATYTFGTGATWNGVRPQRITAASVVSSNGASSGVDIVTAAEFAKLAYDRALTGNFAKILTCDYGFPIANVQLWPKPSAGTIELWSYKPLTQIATLATAIAFAPGYEELLKYNFALAILPEFPRGHLDPTVTKRAAETLASLAALNDTTLGDTAPPVAVKAS